MLLDLWKLHSDIAKVNDIDPGIEDSGLSMDTLLGCLFGVRERAVFAHGFVAICEVKALLKAWGDRSMLLVVRVQV